MTHEEHRQSHLAHMTPNWVLIGGILLALMASAVNVEYMLHLGVSVSHLTGDLTKFTAELTDDSSQNLAKALQLGAAVASFVVGAILAGFFIHHPQLEFGRPYGRSISSIGAILIAAYYVRQFSVDLSIALGALACGLQNGLATHYRGLILRTTHVTGLLTDFGTIVGMKLRGRRIETWKLATSGSLVVAFLCGAAISSWINLNYQLPFLPTVGALYLLGGLSVTALKRFFGVTDSKR